MCAFQSLTNEILGSNWGKLWFNLEKSFSNLFPTVFLALGGENQKMDTKIKVLKLNSIVVTASLAGFFVKFKHKNLV